MHASKEQQKTLERLKKRSDFLKMNKSCKKWVSHGFVLQVLPNDLGHHRVGFTVTKRTDKSAVNRNRIKRRLRSIAADILPKNAKTSCDYVLIGRHAAATRPYDTLCRDLKWCLKKMDYWVK